MSRNTLRITDLEALAAFDNGKFVDSEEIKTIKHTPKRDMIKAALMLGIKVPGVEQNTAGDSLPAVGTGAEVSLPPAPVPEYPEFLNKKA